MSIKSYQTDILNNKKQQGFNTTNIEKEFLFLYGEVAEAFDAYKSSLDALSKFPERCTAIGVRLKEGNIELIAPYGIDDIASFIVQPTPYFEEDSERIIAYQNRVTKKNWQEKWPQLVIKNN